MYKNKVQKICTQVILIHFSHTPPPSHNRLDAHVISSELIYISMQIKFGYNKSQNQLKMAAAPCIVPVYQKDG